MLSDYFAGGGTCLAVSIFYGFLVYQSWPLCFPANANRLLRLVAYSVSFFALRLPECIWPRCQHVGFRS